MSIDKRSVSIERVAADNLVWFVVSLGEEREAGLGHGLGAALVGGGGGGGCREGGGGVVSLVHRLHCDDEVAAVGHHHVSHLQQTTQHPRVGENRFFFKKKQFNPIF